MLPVSDPPVSATTRVGTGGRSLVELLEEVPAGVTSVPVDGVVPVDPSADPEEAVISGVTESVAGALPVSEPPVLVTTGVGVTKSLVELPKEVPAGMSVPVDGAVPADPSVDPEEAVISGVASVVGVLRESDPSVVVTTGVGVAGRSLVELSEEVPAGAMSVPVDGTDPVDPSADPEEAVISGVTESVAGALPVSEPPVLATTGVGVAKSLVALPEEVPAGMSVPVDGAVPADPSVDPEEAVISGVASVAGVPPVSEPPVVIMTGVGVEAWVPSGPSA